MKLTHLTLSLAALVMAVSMAMAAETTEAPKASPAMAPQPEKAEIQHANIGLTFGVIKPFFFDSRIVGVGDYIGLDFLIDKNLGLRIFSEDIRLDGEKGSAQTDGTMDINGLGIDIRLTDSKSFNVSVGLAFGKCTAYLPPIPTGPGTIDQTVPFAEINFYVGMLKTSNIIIADLGLSLGIRFVEIEDEDVFAKANDQVSDLNSVNLGLKASIMF